MRVVVPSAAGGSSDTLGRLVSQKLRERLGQPVVVDNRPGAGQMIGADHAAKSAPDGYTLIFLGGTYTTSAAIQPKLPFDPVNDLTGVAMAGEGPFMLVVHHYTKDKILPAGWVGYFPEGVHYGPQTRKQGLYMLLCQCGGATGSGFMSERQYIEGQDALAGKGTLAKGLFTYVGEDGKEHRQDAFEAMYEQAMGRKPKYPEPRYNDIVTMNPANFDWMEDKQNAGVAHKLLGTFTEKRTTISFIRLDRGATVNVGGSAGPDLLFVSKGSIESGGSECPLHSAIGFEALEGPVAIKGLEPTEIFRMQLEA